ncbi:Oidioi.mRNA.OKI2018_I69.XSR.g15549.t1.cds [Oikopleura dioica]|uniref:Oidioi.mRNA.OKI2018_I69.XSR.g15549.t1.cds n=1 Tax=Oikopleura dioica TaxID=34765 RepID=A0ABN7SD75_OIKDI|nr:Oidioi.mRNA.OKI2018_I69.XSR.g15549.t1.cds [Oikopleura dioica]
MKGNSIKYNSKLSNSLRLNPRKARRNRARTPIYKETVVEIAIDKKHCQRSGQIGGVHVSGRVGISGEKGSREKSYLANRLARIMRETNPVKLVDYLRTRIEEEEENFLEALSRLFPYEEFPLFDKMHRSESFYKKSIFFSKEGFLIKDPEVSEKEFFFPDDDNDEQDSQSTYDDATDVPTEYDALSLYSQNLSMHVFPDQGMKNIYEDILDEQSQHVDTLLPKSAALGLIKKNKFQESVEKRNTEIIEENVNEFGSRNMKTQKSSWGHCVRCHKEFSSDSESCELPHPSCDMVLRRRDDKKSFYRCLTCGAGVSTNGPYEESIKHGLCFLGTHTLDIKEVTYRNETGAAKTCKEEGCNKIFFV